MDQLDWKRQFDMPSQLQLLRSGKKIAAIWLIEIEYSAPEANTTATACFRATCSKYNTAINRAWKWCDRNNKTVVHIHATRSIDELNYQLDEYDHQLK